MKFNLNKFLIYILIFIILSGCQNVKDTLSMKKKKSYDEFVKKNQKNKSIEEKDCLFDSLFKTHSKNTR